ncbi:MAG: hypothetical protein E3J72_14330 [Planctomycetota bacterium]|nr:MAG: hypothetical protein E3J72_14330 [Planctomycetota bacterium]
MIPSLSKLYKLAGGQIITEATLKKCCRKEADERGFTLFITEKRRERPQSIHDTTRKLIYSWEGEYHSYTAWAILTKQTKGFEKREVFETLYVNGIYGDDIQRSLEVSRQPCCIRADNDGVYITHANGTEEKTAPVMNYDSLKQAFEKWLMPEYKFLELHYQPQNWIDRIVWAYYLRDQLNSW